MPTTEEIKSIKSALSKFEKAKKLQIQLAELESELNAYGLKLPKLSRKSTGSAAPVKRTPINEDEVIKFFGDKELGYVEVANRVGKGPQTVKKWLESNSKFSKRKEDPKNKKSKVLYKVK
jgi:hypothetical protein